MYLVSNTFDYENYLCPDVGNAYADLLGLPVQQIRALPLKDDQTYIVDPQLSSEEVDFLRFKLLEKPLRVVFRIIDPYWPPQDTNPLRMMAFEVSSHSGTAVLSAYEPSEMVDLLLRVYGSRRFHVSPYPYDQSKELPFHWHRRKQQIAITGNHNPVLYPLRALARRKRLTSPRWRLITADLAHPGYVIGENPKCIVGDTYIRYLSQFAMMFVCPSRGSLEFLKFRECGYAGCCPVGQAPHGFPSKASKAIYPISLSGFKEEFHSLRMASRSALLDRAKIYRADLARKRSPAFLHESLMNWLQSVYS